MTNLASSSIWLFSRTVVGPKEDSSGFGVGVDLVWIFRPILLLAGITHINRLIEQKELLVQKLLTGKSWG